MLVAAEASSNLLGVVLGPLAVLALLLFLWSHQVRTERMKHWRSLARQHKMKMSGNSTLLETVMIGRVGGSDTRVWMGGAQGGGSIAICSETCQKITKLA